MAFDPELVGTWVAQDDEEFVFTMIDTTRGVYTLLCDESGATARFEAVLVELGSETFLDIYPDEPDNDNSFYLDHLLRVHNILRVQRDADTLWVADFDERSLLRVHPVTGDVDRRIAVKGHPTGLAWDGERLWYADSEWKLVSRILDPLA